MSEPTRKVERWKVEPPAPLAEKSALLADVKETAKANGWTIVRLWAGLHPELHLIEAIMLEYTEC